MTVDRRPLETKRGQTMATEEKTETIVLLIRHEEHGKCGVPKNALTPEGRARAVRSGQVLRGMDYKIDVAISSHQPRAVETILCVMQGMEKMVPLDGLNHAFGAATDGEHAFTGDEIASLKAKSEETGSSLEELLVFDPEFAEKKAVRGREGADALLSLVEAHQGKTIAIASHGGSRLEAVVKALQGEFSMFERGSVAVLTFGGGLNLEKVEYLGNLASDPSNH